MALRVSLISVTGVESDVGDVEYWYILLDDWHGREGRRYGWGCGWQWSGSEERKDDTGKKLLYCSVSINKVQGI